MGKLAVAAGNENVPGRATGLLPVLLYSSLIERK